MYSKACPKLDDAACTNCATLAVANCSAKVRDWISAGELKPPCDGAYKGFLVDTTICTKSFNREAKYSLE